MCELTGRGMIHPDATRRSRELSLVAPTNGELEVLGKWCSGELHHRAKPTARGVRTRFAH
jgi:hypothetical protein